VPTRRGRIDQTERAASSRECDGDQSSAVAPFLLGTVLGGLFGAVLGTALSPHTRGFFVGLYHLINRRLSSSDRDQLRFELLLQ
jgi:hypothetical protein